MSLKLRMGGNDMSDGPSNPSKAKLPMTAATLGRMVLSLGVWLLIMAVAMFLPAGDIRWMKGWLFLLVFLVQTVVAVLYLRRRNPAIFVARRKIHEGTKPWDKVLLLLLLPSFLSIFPLAALDDGRFHWSSVPTWLIVLGYILFSIGFVVSVWVYAVNKFAEPGVRIQTERGHRVVDIGPYAIVRHPLYLAAFILCVGIPFALGSFWALVPVAIFTLILVVRTTLEDRTLQNELEGYREYADRVCYRLVPGVW
jgi:protein-S-isoprenylcysteine O-methyltransferase Ste14